LLTKNGQLRSFATSLVSDSHSRILRTLVDNGFLTYEYTGTQRVYTLTEAGGSQFGVPKEGRTVAKKKTKETTNGHVNEAPPSKPTETEKVEQDNKLPSISTAEACRAALAAGQNSVTEALRWAKASYPDSTINDRAFKVTFGKMIKKNEEETAPTPKKNHDEGHATRTKSKSSSPHTSSAPPNLTDLLAVGEIAAQHGGAKKLLIQVALVDDLAKRVGGIDRLRRSLEGLQTLAKLFK
jgi:hypothetical protein